MRPPGGYACDVTVRRDVPRQAISRKMAGTPGDLANLREILRTLAPAA